MSFPKNFVWGAATAAYQIEGAHLADGKGLSVWDTFTHTPEKIWLNQTGDTACDHYHLWQEDIKLMRQIGLKAYRFSICWPRVMPEGVGKINKPGLDFYDKLTDCLLENDISPWATLFHWDLPYALQCRGGWLNPDSPQWFADYVAIVVDKLSDRITNWFTLNEPQCFVNLGHGSGMHAPGLRLPLRDLLQLGHHALLGHGKAVQVIRSRVKKPCKVGYAPVGSVCMPMDEKPENVEAARVATFDMAPKPNLWNSIWWMEPVFKGVYPPNGVRMYGEEMPQIHKGDMETICQPLDFIGANIYSASRYKANSGGAPLRVEHETGISMNAYGWAITPEVLYWGAKFYHERYKLPVIITENGVPIVDLLFRDNTVKDPQRSEYIDTHVLGVKRALDEKIPVEGYFYWSLMDNFEWQEGFKQRFGLVYVDYPSQKRTIKESGWHYKKIIETNGACIK